MSLVAAKMPAQSLRHCTAALIDLDGTLVDTLGDFKAALDLTLADLGYPGIGRDTIESLVGRGSEHLIRSVLSVSGAPQELYELAWTRYQFHYDGINGMHSTVYSGTHDFLTALRERGWPLACLTNKPTAAASALLASKGLSAYFDHVFGGDAFEHRKPHPLPLLRACEALARTPAHTLMVGDSINDANAARAAGCPVALVTWGYNHGEPVALAPHDLLVDQWLALLRSLD